MRRPLTTSNDVKSVDTPAELTGGRSQTTLKLSRFTCVLAVISAMAFSAACSKQEERKPAPRLQAPQSLDEASQRMVGTWTYTERVGDDYPWWVKWTIRSDGTTIQCEARPSDDDWGVCTERKESKFVTDKYADTGTRWFGVRDGAMVAIYVPENDTMEIRIARYPWIGVMKRGDKNPFSK
jgi:hypothetical protein